MLECSRSIEGSLFEVYYTSKEPPSFFCSLIGVLITYGGLGCCGHEIEPSFMAQAWLVVQELLTKSIYGFSSVGTIIPV